MKQTVAGLGIATTEDDITFTYDPSATGAAKGGQVYVKVQYPESDDALATNVEYLTVSYVDADVSNKTITEGAIVIDPKSATAKDIQDAIDAYNKANSGSQITTYDPEKNEVVTKGALDGKTIVNPTSKDDIQKLIEAYNETHTGSAAINTEKEVVTGPSIVVTGPTVVVKPETSASALEITKSAVSVENGKTTSVVATGAAGAVTVTSSDNSVASVSYKDGTISIKANKAGTAVITVTDAGLVSDAQVIAGGQKTIVVTVKAIAKVSGVRVANKKGARVKVSFKKVKGATYQIRYTVAGKKAKTVTSKSASKTIKVAKGKKVTVQVRAKKNGKYGAWSAQKSLRTDKK